MDIHFHIEKRHLVVFLIAIGLIVGVGFVYASLQGKPTPVGHSVSELEKCSDGEILKMISGQWDCATESGSSTATDVQCTDCIQSGEIQNGQVTTSDINFNFAGSNSKGGTALTLGRGYYPTCDVLNNAGPWPSGCSNPIEDYRKWSTTCVKAYCIENGFEAGIVYGVEGEDMDSCANNPTNYHAYVNCFHISETY